MSLRATSKVLFFVALCSLIPLVSVKAVTISPVRLELSGDPGSVARGEFKIFNEQKEAQIFYSDFENFEARDESGAPFFVGNQGDLASWIDAPREISVPSGASRTVPFTVAIPADTEPGGHFAAIFLGTASGASGAGQVLISGKVGILVLLRVNGPIAEGGNLLEFDTQDQARLFTSLPVAFFYRFQNSGTDRAKPSGELVIRNLFGGTAAVLDANQGGGNILPESTRRFTVTWAQSGTPAAAGIEADRGSFFSQLRAEWHNFALGRYTAELNLRYGAEQQSAQSTLTFWVLPWRLLVVGGISLLVLIFLLTASLRRYNRWIIARALNH